MSKELRLLIVQERAADADALVRVLKSAGFEISARRAGSREEFLRDLHEFEPGAIVAALALPELPALEALQLARKLGPNVPFVVVTEAADEEGVLACLRAGADDYVVRPHLARLPAALTAALDRRRLHSERRQLEETYRTLVENSLQGLAIFQQQRIVYANAEFARLVGYSPEEILAMPRERIWDSVLAPEREELLRRQRDRLAGKEVPTRLEFRLRHRDGSVRWLEVMAALITYQDEPAILTAFVDVTERKRAEEALRASEAMLKAVLDTIPVRVFWKDLESRYLGCNAPFARDAGLAAPEDLLGRDDYQMGWREQADLYRADDRQVMDTGVAKMNYEEPQTTPDGGRIWLRTSKIPLRNAAGAVFGVLGTYEDITERKRAEEALRASEARFRALFEAMEEGVALHEVVLDANGKLVDYVIVDVNPAYERITGISRERAAGRRASELYGSGSPPYLEEFGGVGVTGVPRHMVTHFAPMNKTFSISITCLGPGQFATVFVEVHGEGPAGLT